MFPAAACDLYRACLFLHQAEALLGGIIRGKQRSIALIYAAMHLMEIARLAAAHQQSIERALAMGENPVFERSTSYSGRYGQQDPSFWSQTSWGQMVDQIISTNPRIGIIAL